MELDFDANDIQWHSNETRQPTSGAPPTIQCSIRLCSCPNYIMQCMQRASC
jgi:hypothetical protein